MPPSPMSSFTAYSKITTVDTWISVMVYFMCQLGQAMVPTSLDKAHLDVAVQILFSLRQFHLFTFCFVAYSFGIIFPKQHCSYQCQERYSSLSLTYLIQYFPTFPLHFSSNFPDSIVYHIFTNNFIISDISHMILCENNVSVHFSHTVVSDSL